MLFVFGETMQDTQLRQPNVRATVGTKLHVHPFLPFGLGIIARVTFSPARDSTSCLTSLMLEDEETSRQSGSYELGSRLTCFLAIGQVARPVLV